MATRRRCDAIRSSALNRQSVFVTTKLWNADHGREPALGAFERNLERLALEYVDLYLIHWPVPMQDRYVETWRALIELQADGRARSIGVSNFEIDHLQRLIDATGVVPAVNQVELHPRFQQADLRRFHAEHGIVTEAGSPLAKGAILNDFPSWLAGFEPLIARPEPTFVFTPKRLHSRRTLEPVQIASTGSARFPESSDGL